MGNIDKTKIEYTILEYIFEGHVDNDLILNVDDFLNYLELLSDSEKLNILNTLSILKDKYKRYNHLEEYIKIRIRNYGVGLIIIEIETTLPIVSDKYLESTLFQERGNCRVANSSGPYNSSKLLES